LVPGRPAPERVRGEWGHGDRPATADAIEFGGIAGNRLVNTTLVYNETTNGWTNRSGTIAPGPRADVAFAFDPAANFGALFGGLTNLTSLASSNDTWKVSASGAWTREVAGSGPAARQASAFAIDPSLGIGLLYGGWNQSFSPTSAVLYSDLWELNLTNWRWTQISVSGPRPPPLEGATMTWDPNIARFLMFGGCYPCTANVWEFDPVGGTWLSLPAAPTAPTGRGAATWAYDPTFGGELLFGGTGGSVAFNDTYLFYPTNTTWVPQTLLPRPAARYGAASGFLDVPGNETLLVAGGLTGGAALADLWRLSATSALSIQTVNASAPSSPLTGVRLNLSGRLAGSTDGGGFLNLSQVNVVNQVLTATDDPYFVPANRTLWLAPGQSETLTSELVPEPLGNVTVFVNDSAGSQLFGVYANLTVDSVRINPLPLVTVEFENATFHGVPPGRANVSTNLPSWRPAYVLTVLAPGASATVNTTLFPDPLLTVFVLGRLPGDQRVSLDRAVVSINGVELGMTDLSGELDARTTAFGLTLVEATASGFVVGGEYVEVPFTGPVETTIVINSLPFGGLGVSVVSNTTHGSISGATVSANSNFPLAWGPYGAVNLTNNFGFAELALPQGSYFIVAAATGYFSSNPTPYDILAGVNASIVILLDPIPPASVHFVVRDNATHQPIANASVLELGTPPPVRTDARGLGNFTDLLPGTYTFVITATGYLANSTDLTLVSYENLTKVVNLSLAPVREVGGAPGGWSFQLFSGDTGDLWPFLAAPLFVVLAGFVYGSVRRAAGPETPPSPPRWPRAPARQAPSSRRP